jgi:hypothetical protein
MRIGRQASLNTVLVLKCSFIVYEVSSIVVLESFECKPFICEFVYIYFNNGAAISTNIVLIAEG